MSKKGHNMKHMTINVSELLKDEVLEKDLKDNEQICPICHGLGMVLYNNEFYHVEDTDNLTPAYHNNMAFGYCPHCFNGVIKVCKYCGKPLPRERNSCDCVQQQAKDKQLYEVFVQQAISKAIEVTESDVNDAWLSDYNGFNYYSNVNDFIEQIQDQYSEENHNYKNFDEFYETEVPKYLWLCETEGISLNAYNIVSDACEDLHEDAMDSISSTDIKELQNYISNWCNKQSGTDTLFVAHKKYVVVKKNWFFCL